MAVLYRVVPYIYIYIYIDLYIYYTNYTNYTNYTVLYCIPYWYVLTLLLLLLSPAEISILPCLLLLPFQ